MNILLACILFMKDAVVGGITWDAIKYGGERVLSKFKKKLRRHFINDAKAEAYLKMLTEKEVYDIENPFRDAMLLYQRTNKGHCRDDFEKDFKEWIVDNRDILIECANRRPNIETALYIGTQTVYGGHVENIGIKKADD